MRYPFLATLLPICCLALSGCGESLDDDLLSIEPAPVEEVDSKSDKANLDGVEIKAMIAAADLSHAAKVLNLLPSKASRREVYFYDEPSLALFDAGLIL